MPLDRNYFNSLDLRPVKRKFYDITAVDNILVDIRKQAELMNHRCESLQTELQNSSVSYESFRAKEDSLNRELLSVREELSSARTKLAESEARIRALEILLEKYEKEKKTAEEKTAAAPDRIVGFSSGIEQLEEMYNSMKHIYLSGMESLDRQWQSFLGKNPQETVPEDLSAKIEGIAETMQEINGQEY